MGTKVTCAGEANDIFTVFRMRNGSEPKDRGSVLLLDDKGYTHGWEAIDKCEIASE